jgi:hypothetical protein
MLGFENKTMLVISSQAIDFDVFTWEEGGEA